MKKKPLLSICIPTYNRSFYLDLALKNLVPQVEKYSDICEIIISDNCSIDNTEEIAKSYLQNSNVNLVFNRNKENLGADKNFLQCFNLASGKYVQIMGDDDIWLSNKLEKIINILNKHEISLLYLDSYPYLNDFLLEAPRKNQTEKYYMFKKSNEFLKYVSFMITFASGFIFNKDILSGLKVDNHLNSNIVQVSWFLDALKAQNKKIVYCDMHCLACKSSNTGGYKLFKVFGENFIKILTLYNGSILNYSTFQSIKSDLLQSFFPKFIEQARDTENYKFEEENYVNILESSFKDNWYYNFFTKRLIANNESIMLKIIKRVVNNCRNYYKKFFLLVKSSKFNI